MAAESILEREIREQPESVERLLARIDDDVRPLAAAVERRPPSYAVVAARGTSDNAARYAQYLLGGRLGLPAALAAPALTSVYGEESALRLRDALVIGISQSGRSPDVVEVLRVARASGSPAVALTNEPEAPLAQAADVVVPLCAGPEGAIAATKTYTASLVALAALDATLRGAPDDLERLHALPAVLADAVKLAFADVPALDGHVTATHVLSIGRGVNLATAFELALKVRELSAIVAEGFSPADLLHGPIAATAPGTPVLVVDVGGPARESLAEAVAALEARGEVAARITDGAAAGAVLRIPRGLPEWLSPIPAIVPGQVYAMRQAALRGLDVDRPAGLRKVTTTF